MSDDERVIEELAKVLTQLWGGGSGGEYGGVYVMASERQKLRPALKAFMDRCRAKP